MSTSKSWFKSPSSGMGRLLSNSSHELPRWRTPSSMAASIIPPPIIQSTYVPRAEPSAESVITEKPSPFNERQHELEADLQYLLDAQAEGLIRGLQGGSLDDRSSTGSTTPTIQSVRSASSRRQRKPVRRQLGLRSARKGIFNSIVALSALKDDELKNIDNEATQVNITLEQIEDWEQRRQGLKEASGNVDSSEDTVRVERLKQEADALQVEINQVEMQLGDMKSRHRKLMRQAAAVENSVQAKMASYSSSLRMLEEDIQKFLSVRPPEDEQQPQPQDGKLSIWQLPPKRRNLDMAKEYWKEQQEMTSDREKVHQYEKDALVEGAQMWRDSVVEITEFEKRLRNETSSLRPASPNSQSAWEEPASTTKPDDRLKDLLRAMDGLIITLDKRYRTADEKSWRLLIAAIGAELDAMRRGRQILAGVLNVVSENLVDTNGNTQTPSDTGEEIRALDRSFELPRPVGGSVSDTTDEHDEPDPELLFSRQDTDTE